MYIVRYMLEDQYRFTGLDTELSKVWVFCFLSIGNPLNEILALFLVVK